eukprot:Gregarina_sp_Poly_1__2065@NODE_1543_length_3881_cov_98_229942_g1018_i0_p6_GENE_NODE_1543_length_3881_cov_98_229942_g1018_i0NODE_1543_length_3881_cov_98_229942_g1018_i0_p6_ORF_typecomplete_len117_score13_49DUF2151/PF10221_9/0_0053_NODE_1543_length_3881_cov_98_229942_g1018_i014941844
MSAEQAPLKSPGTEQGPDLAPLPESPHAPLPRSGTEESEVREGDLHAGYKSSLHNLLHSKAKLAKMKRMKEQAQEDDTNAKYDVELFHKYLDAVKIRDNEFPEYLTCLGCRQRYRG